MQASVFDFQEYKVYLGEWLKTRPGRGRGEKSRIATALHCHTAYVTHVFRGTAHFSLEQAADLSTYLGHRPDEQRYFMLLVQLARAGNRSLKAFLETERRKLIETRLELKNRLQFKHRISDEDQSKFYSAWYYLAVYAMVSVPEFKSVEAISERLRLPRQTVSEVLEFLVSRGILRIEQGTYQVSTTSIHLGNDSPMISKHHTNWRIQSIRSLEVPQPTALHYSSVISLSHADVPRVRAALIRALEEVRAIVAPSKEEAVFAYALDLFELGEPTAPS